ncbi:MULTISPECIES: hypothetical protein [Citricoccus]|uniref:hypothetical protein n=1 Tax=Citricoccus TaxID=169133 RepID=UPI000255DF98|nr:hypothetical protein [Citricoccus sp. CH26A]
MDSDTVDGNEETAGVGSSIVIRMWREPEHDRQFRARLIRTGWREDVDVALVADPDAVLKQVEKWLAEFTASGT